MFKTNKSWLFFLLFLSYLDISLAKSNKPFTNSPSRTVHIQDFGAVNNGLTECTIAFQRASDYLQKNGGTLIIDPGIYIVGKQKRSTSFFAGYSYLYEPIISFKDVKYPIKIVGYNATLKIKDGLKFGSFNPISGRRDSVRKVGNKSDYNASAYKFIYAENCSNISIEGLTLDGNCTRLDISASFGDEGIQLPATGISLYCNKQVVIKNCTIHHCALDAITIAWTGLKNTDPLYPHILTNIKATYNGRQGLSWVGGNSLKVTNCEFSFTGKSINNGLPVVSKPAAGIDIEIEESIIKNGTFNNCFVYNNTGPGLSSIGHETYNIKFDKVTFIGTTNSAAFPKSQGFSFSNCTFVGKVERIFGSQDKNKAAFFKSCSFTMDSTKSPNKKVFGDYCEFYEAKNVIFDDCEFNGSNKRLPVFNQKEIVFLNCRFSQNSNIDFHGSASFKGKTEFIMKGQGKLNFDESTFEGPIIYNGQKSYDIKKIKIREP